MKRLVLMLSLLLCGEMASSEDASNTQLKKYIGGEAGFRLMRFHSSEKELFSSRLSGANVFGGVKFSESWGVEAGYHLSKGKKKADNRHKIDGYHAMLMGYLPVLTDINLLGGLGIGHLKMSLQGKSHTLKVKKVVPRVTSGLQVGLTDSISARGMISWEDTRRLKHKELKPKQSVNLTLGFLASF